MGADAAALPFPTAASNDGLDPRLKYDTSRKKPIVLIPQPSDDPDDPLVERRNPPPREKLSADGLHRIGR